MNNLFTDSQLRTEYSPRRYAPPPSRRGAFPVPAWKAAALALLSLWTAAVPAAPNPPTAEDPMISITPVTRSMEQTGGSAAINTAGSGTWRASTSANWILLTSSSGAAGYPVGYTVGANNGVEARVGYVYVSGYVHTITQAGLGASLESYSAAFESAGGAGSVRVNAPAGKTWHATSNADWITVSTESGTGSSACAFTVAAYDEVSTRSGTLTIADNTFTVFQTGPRMRLGAAGATTDYFAGTLRIRVNALADTAWTVAVDQDWLAVADAGNGLGGDEVKVAVEENPSYNTRTGTVTIGTETFAVTQLGRTALVFRIAPAEVEAFGVDGAAGERIAVTATPDLGWTAAASADWIELSEGFAGGAGGGSVVYRVKPNPTLRARAGTIIVTAADGAVAAKRLDIAQEAAVASLTVAEYEFEAGGETLAVGVSTGGIVEWTVDGLPAWLSASALSMTGPGGVTLAAAANTSVQPRSATIRIADHDFRVSQKGRGVTVSYEPRVFDADGKATGENPDNAIAVSADADVAWSAVASDETWIIVYEGKTGQGDGTVRFIVAPYVGDGEIRTGLITIGSEIVYVTQRPYELSIEPNGTRVDGNAGAGEIQVALDIAGVWNAIATEPWISIVSGYDAGTGNGKVLFSYTDNNTGRQRTGKIIIAGETYTLTQAARQNFAVSATAQGRGGHVAGGGVYGLDEAISLVAVPEGGYAFDHWILPGGGTSAANPLAVVVTAAESYQAVFVPADPALAVESASLRGVQLAWADLPWATELRVFRGTSENRAQATRIATVANDGSCRYLDATGTENQAYWYWVEAVGAGNDVWSGGVQGTRAKATFSIDYTNLRGTTHANPATYREGSSLAFAAPSSRTGFTFLGWTPAGIAADTSGDVTARANWAQNEYTVRFDLAGAAGSMADESFTYGLWKYLSPTNFSRAGYTFVGWAVQPTAAAAVYDDSESVKSLTAEPDGLMTLYALWLRDGLDDPLPDLGASASSSDIVAVLVGCVDAGNLGANITSAAEYADFRAWADAVRDGSGAAAGHTGVRDSPHSWLSYALGKETLLEAAPEPGDLVILDFAASESDPSRFDLLFGLDGIAVGSSAKPANLAKTFAIEGAESLEDGFSEEAVALLSIGPSEGDITSSVAPVSDAESFFFRVVERPARTTGLYTLAFDSAGGTAVAPITQEYGTPVAMPADPTRPGYFFTGWIPAIPPTMPAGNRTYTAQWTEIPTAPYCIIDLSGGANASSYSVTYLTDPPEGGFNTDEYKTTKLVLRRLEPGPVPTRDATLTTPFYVGLFEVTQKQWELVMGTRPSYFSNNSYYATRPVEQVSFNMIRGSSLGSQWPTSNVVDSDSFLGKLRARTGIDFDLPTEAQWEYACRAGTMTDYNSGKNHTNREQDDAMDEVGRYRYNGGSSYSSSCTTASGTAAVGSYLPNAWGLYDMHGNVWEWCLDWSRGSLSGNDPVGSSSGSSRVERGGSWGSYPGSCTSSYRYGNNPSIGSNYYGFRLVRTLSN